MNIEKINIEEIGSIGDVKKAMKQIVDCIFIMNRDIQRQLTHLTSQNVVSLDFNITKAQNVEKLINKEE